MGSDEFNSLLSAKAKAFSVENLLKENPESKSKVERFKNDKGILVELCAGELWEKFNKIGTEMIVTKAGRRMFPTLKIRFYGLSLSSSYIVYMDVVPIGNTKYRYIYHSSRWTTAGARDSSCTRSRIYIHPDSPASGHLWTSQGHVSFDRVKLTNNKKPIVRGQISLHSMHKYQPRVHILHVPDFISVPSDCLIDYVLENRQKASTFVFPHTSFITVTAYQNQEITRLKIRSNPFAKGFREPCCKRENSLKNTRNISSSSSQQISLPRFSLPHQVPVKFVIPPKGWTFETVFNSSNIALDNVGVL